MIPRPRFKIPIWAALAIVGAAYLLRSIFMRGGELTPDLPGDLVMAAVLAVGLALAGWLKHQARSETQDEAAEERDGEDQGGGGEGQ